jgi:hypothetical protein
MPAWPIGAPPFLTRDADRICAPPRAFVKRVFERASGQERAAGGRPVFAKARANGLMSCGPM